MESRAAVTFASLGQQFTGDDVRKEGNYPEKERRNGFLLSSDAATFVCFESGCWYRRRLLCVSVELLKSAQLCKLFKLI